MLFFERQGLSWKTNSESIVFREILPFCGNVKYKIIPVTSKVPAAETVVMANHFFVSMFFFKYESSNSFGFPHPDNTSNQFYSCLSYT